MSIDFGPSFERTILEEIASLPLGERERLVAAAFEELPETSRFRVVSSGDSFTQLNDKVACWVLDGFCLLTVFQGVIDWHKKQLQPLEPEADLGES